MTPEQLEALANEFHASASTPGVTLTALCKAAVNMENTLRSIAATMRAGRLTWERIEYLIPEQGVHSTDDGWLKVSAQWMHDFAHAIADAAVLAALGEKK